MLFFLAIILLLSVILELFHFRAAAPMALTSALLYMALILVPDYRRISRSAMDFLNQHLVTGNNSCTRLVQRSALYAAR